MESLNDSVKVYFHRNPTTNEVFYVGIGIGKRPYNTLQRSRVWKNYVARHGAPIVEVVHHCSSWEEAQALEIKYIKDFGRRDQIETGKLVNLTDGGEGAYGRKLSEHSRHKLRLSHLGKKMNSASRLKMSEAKRGKGYPKPALRKPIVLFDRHGNVVKEYQVTKDVAKDGHNPNMAARMAHSKTAFRSRDKSFFVRKEDTVCPAYMAIRLELANCKRIFTEDGMKNLRNKKRQRHGLDN